MTWFYLALAVPALWGIANFIDKYLLEKKINNPLLLTITLIFAGLVIIYTNV